VALTSLSPPLSKLKHRTFAQITLFREVGGIKEAEMRILFERVYVTVAYSHGLLSY